ncbi:MAG: glutathione S-transferase family protein [Burkholderiales bacterium]|nr:glutathione S-transferase family protein [Burkholderiales bacterium]
MSDYTLVIGNKNYSSWSLRPWVLMQHAGIPFRELRIPLRTSESAVQIRSHSPSGRVPVLIDGPLTIWDSLAISEYLAERHPELHLWPQRGDARAVARSVSAEMHSGFQALRSGFPMNCRRSLPGIVPSPEAMIDVARILALWRDCRARFGAGGPFLFGTFSVADAMYAPVAFRFATYGVELDAVGDAYRDTLIGLPAMQRWLADAQAETEVVPAFEPHG